jgi:signal transduction histidine kinase
MFHSKLLYILLIMFTYCQVQAQLPAIDLIRQKVAVSKNDKEQLAAIMELTNFRNSLHADTAKLYFTAAKQLALKAGDQKKLRWVEYNLIAGELTKGNTDSIIVRIEKEPALQFNKSEDPELFYKLQLLKANTLNRMNERVKALDLQLGLLQQAEKDNNILMQCYLLNYIGATYVNSDRGEAAKSNWLRALQLINKNPQPQLKEIETVLNSNLILYYGNRIDSTNNQQMTDSFLFYTNKTIEQSRTRNIYWLLPTALSYRGHYYGVIGKNQEGEADFKEAIDIRSKIGDPLYVAKDYINLASFYWRQKKYDSTINILKRSFFIIKKGHINELNLEVLALLSNSYKQKGDYKAYSMALEQFILDADTANRLNAADKITDILTKYDVQKKETTIANQKLQLAQRLNYIIASLLLVAIGFPAVYFYIKRYKKKQKIEKDTAIQAAETNERKRISAELHDNMGVQANAILHNSSLLSHNPIENEKLVANLQDTAKEMLGNLRETVWALKATEVSCAEIWLRLINFIKQARQNFETINFNISGDNPGALSITSIKALHIIMVIKEAVNNSIKHAHATEIAISGTYKDGWKIIVKDNGVGFDFVKDRTGKDGNGLINMQDRATAGNFSVQVFSEPSKGTSVILQIPL